MFQYIFVTENVDVGEQILEICSQINIGIDDECSIYIGDGTQVDLL